MSALLSLSPRQYTVWLGWELHPLRPVPADVRTAIELDPARLDRWLDMAALAVLRFRIGGEDLAARQRAYDADLRAAADEILPDVSDPTRDAIKKVLDQHGYLPGTPIGGALATCFGSAIAEDARIRKVPVAAPSGLLARRMVLLTGAVRVTEPSVPGLDVHPASSALQALQQAVVGDAKAWKKWCNLITLHAGWEKGHVACLRGLVPSLPRATGAEIGSWLDAPGWFATAAARAFLGSFVLESYSLAIMERTIERQ